MNNLRRMRKAVENVLTEIKSKIVNPKAQVIFLINNYDVVLQTLQVIAHCCCLHSCWQVLSRSRLVGCSCSTEQKHSGRGAGALQGAAWWPDQCIRRGGACREVWSLDLLCQASGLRVDQAAWCRRKGRTSCSRRQYVFVSQFELHATVTTYFTRLMIVALESQVMQRLSLIHI